MSVVKEPTLNRVMGIYLCDPCLDGAGGICHTPGCAMWMKTAPDIPIRDYVIDAGGTIQPLDGESGEREERNNG